MFVQLELSFVRLRRRQSLPPMAAVRKRVSSSEAGTEVGGARETQLDRAGGRPRAARGGGGARLDLGLWLLLTAENWLLDFGRPIYGLYISEQFPLSLPGIGTLPLLPHTHHMHLALSSASVTAPVNNALLLSTPSYSLAPSSSSPSSSPSSSSPSSLLPLPLLLLLLPPPSLPPYQVTTATWPTMSLLPSSSSSCVPGAPDPSPAPCRFTPHRHTHIPHMHTHTHMGRRLCQNCVKPEIYKYIQRYINTSRDI